MQTTEASYPLMAGAWQIAKPASRLSDKYGLISSKQAIFREGRTVDGQGRGMAEALHCRKLEVFMPAASLNRDYSA